jgi:hypothetical protein
MPRAVAPGAFLYTCEDTTMTVRELRAAVVLFKHDGTSQVFALEEVLSNNGYAQLEIYEAEEAESPCHA